MATVRDLEALARCFPCLEKKAKNDPNCGLIPFDATRLMQCVELWSSGEKHAVRFLLTVYNRSILEGHPLGHFSVVEAFGVWDDKHWEAFLRWANHPFIL